MEAARLYRRLAGFGVAKDLLLYNWEVSKLAGSINHVAALLGTLRFAQLRLEWGQFATEPNKTKVARHVASII